MKLALARADLHRALALVGRAVERRNTIPILSNLRLVAQGGGLTITGTDLDLMIETTIPADIAVPGGITVSAATLAGYVGKLADTDQVAIQAGDGRANVRSGRSRAALPTLAIEDFPDLSAGEMTCEFELPGAALAGLLEPVQFAISTEETRYYLNGIYVHAVEGPDGPVLRAVATDGHRLGRADTPQPEGAGAMPGIIIPRKTVSEIIRLAEAAGADHDRPVRVALSAVKISVAIGGDEDGTRGTRLVSKLIDGTFPDYARVIPAGNPNIAALPGPELARAIDRVASVSSERGRAIKLDLGPDGLVLRMNNPDQGEAEEELACAYDGQPLQIGCNARYAGDILTALGTGEIAIAMGDPGAPMVWTSRADPSRLYVLMPMRV